MIAATRHDTLAFEDFRAVRQFGIETVREAARWHLIEARPGEFDFASLDVILDAADQCGAQVLLDLLHFGWPDHVDVMAVSFPERFERFAKAAAKRLRKRSSQRWFIAPVNEISFLSWAGGEAANLNPCRDDCAPELKRNLVRAAARASEVLLQELPNVRLISPEPVIHIVPDDSTPGDSQEAEAYRLAQFEAWDLLAGRREPELGGKPEYLDVLGLNFYERNEWVHNAKVSLPRSDSRYRPFWQIIQEVWNRYERPMFVAETGTEGDARAEWFRYICDEVSLAQQNKLPVHGICLYPILNHPGWDDDRYCPNGLFDYPDARNLRAIYRPLAEAILEQQPRFSSALSYEVHLSKDHASRSPVPLSPPVGVRVSTPAASDESLRPSRPGLLFRRTGF